MKGWNEVVHIGAFSKPHEALTHAELGNDTAGILMAARRRAQEQMAPFRQPGTDWQFVSHAMTVVGERVVVTMYFRDEAQE